jgi:26S proteasome regulatory subunit N12
MILGLNLLRLLAKNKLAEFHTELELIPLEVHHQNVFVKHPVYLEQCMMEGAYNKVTKARSDVPSDTYSFFMDMLMDTVR